MDEFDHVGARIVRDMGSRTNLTRGIGLAFAKQIKTSEDIAPVGVIGRQRREDDRRGDAEGQGVITLPRRYQHRRCQ